MAGAGNRSGSTKLASFKAAKAKSLSTASLRVRFERTGNWDRANKEVYRLTSKLGPRGPSGERSGRLSKKERGKLSKALQMSRRGRTNSERAERILNRRESGNPRVAFIGG